MANIAFSRLGPCFVLVQNQHPATDDEWSSWVSFITKGGLAPGAVRVLVFSAGGSPTPKQRQAIHKLMPSAGGGVPSAVVLSSFIGRTVVTAMGLFNDKVKAFAPDALDEALDYLGVSSPQRPELLEIVARLHHDLGLEFAPKQDRAASR